MPENAGPAPARRGRPAPHRRGAQDQHRIGAHRRPRHQRRRGRGVPGGRRNHPPPPWRGRDRGLALMQTEENAVTTATLAEPTRTVAMARPRILIIEDERGLTDVLSYNLQREGYETIVAHDGQEGLRKAQTLLPEMILLDLMLPTLGGLEVCRELRAGERTRQIPILMLTA